jgi:hypothetical protein
VRRRVGDGPAADRDPDVAQLRDRDGGVVDADQHTDDDGTAEEDEQAPDEPPRQQRQGQGQLARRAGQVAGVPSEVVLDDTARCQCVVRVPVDAVPGRVGRAATGQGLHQRPGRVAAAGHGDDVVGLLDHRPQRLDRAERDAGRAHASAGQAHRHRPAVLGRSRSGPRVRGHAVGVAPPGGVEHRRGDRVGDVVRGGRFQRGRRDDAARVHRGEPPEAAPAVADRPGERQDQSDERGDRGGDGCRPLDRRRGPRGDVAPLGAVGEEQEGVLGEVGDHGRGGAEEAEVGEVPGRRAPGHHPGQPAQDGESGAVAEDEPDVRPERVAQERRVAGGLEPQLDADEVVQGWSEVPVDRPSGSGGGQRRQGEGDGRRAGDPALHLGGRLHRRDRGFGLGGSSRCRGRCAGRCRRRAG